MKNPSFCNDYGDNPLCQKEPDPRYTMRFDDLGEPPILWCAHCGPGAQAMASVIAAAIDERGDPFVDEFRSLVDKASAEKVIQ